MTASRDFDRALRAHFDATADRTVLDGQVEAILTSTIGRRQRPGWVVTLRSFLMSTTTRSLGRTMPASAWIVLLAALVLIGVLAAGLASGAFRVAPRPIVNGPIVYGRYDTAAGDTVIHIVRPDGTGDHVLVPGPNECPQFSPDGRLVALGMGVVGVDGTGRQGSPTTVTVGPLTLGCTTWSPDGTRWAAEGWYEKKGSGSGIFLVDAASGANPTRLTTNDIGGNDIPGDFSPDGRRLTFQRADQNERGKLMVVDIADGATHEVAGLDGIASWSFDGRWLVTVRGDHLVIVHPDGSAARTIQIPTSGQIDWLNGPQFSPDGSRIVFAMALKGAPDAAVNGDIYTIGSDGNDLMQLTATPNDNEYFTDWGVDPS
jgi:hypothetical protein